MMTHLPSTKLSETKDLTKIIDMRGNETPEKNAFIFLENGNNVIRTVSYEKLMLQAKAIAITLQMKTKINDRVVLLYPSGPDFISALFGCFYAGVIAVPLPPPDPAEFDISLSKIKGMIKNANPSVILTSSDISILYTLFKPAEWDMDGIEWLNTEDIGVDMVERWSQRSAEDNDIAYLQYTSGSTGTPKGVMVSHENIVHQQKLIQFAVKSSENSKMVSWLPLYHDMGLISSILHPLYVGATSIILSPSDFINNPLCWIDTISKYQATTSAAPNFGYDLVIKKASQEPIDHLDLSHWKCAVNGSEPIRKKTIDNFTRIFSQYGFSEDAFFLGYGLSEATLVVSGSRVNDQESSVWIKKSGMSNHHIVMADKDDPDAIRLMSSGNIAIGQKVRIVDHDTGTPCPQGKIGEIWVSGKSVAKGYWQNQTDTEHTFGATISDNHDGPVSHDGHYLKTGDLGFILNRSLYVTGRLKDLIIIHGENHYPQDIELTVSNSHDMLKKGCTAAFSVDIDGIENLVIFQETISDACDEAILSKAVERIRSDVAKYHDIQTFSIRLLKPGTLFKTTSGKIQRWKCKKAFEKDFFHQKNSQVIDQRYLKTWTYRPPKSDLEKTLCLLWAEILDVPFEELDGKSNFMDMGGSSLLLTQMQSRIEDELGILIPIEVMFEVPVLCDMVTALTQYSGSSSKISAVIKKIPRKTSVFPLSYSQKRLWFVQQLNKNSTLYNLPFVLRMKGELDIEGMNYAANSIIMRHDTLRTRFVLQEGIPYQIIDAPENINPLQVMDLRDLPDNRKEVRTHSLIDEEIRKPFNMETDHLVRVKLLKLRDDDHVFIIVIHHIIVDGWSQQIMLQEFSELYNSFVEHRGSRLAHLDIQYVDYVFWQKSQFESGNALQAQVEYWKNQLKNRPEQLILPTDRKRPEVLSFRGKIQNFYLEFEEVEKIQRLGRTCDATLFMTLMAAYQILIYRYSLQEDILIGIPIANRKNRQIENLIGFFVNTLVIRGRISHNMTIKEFISQIRKTSLEAYNNQDVPFDYLVDQLDVERRLNRNPVFQAMLAFNQEHYSDRDKRNNLSLSKIETTRIEASYNTAQFDITLHLFPWENGRLKCTLEYATDLFEEFTIKRMIRHFNQILKGMIMEPETEIGGIPLLSEDEIFAQTVERNKPSSTIDNEITFISEFEKIVRRLPGKKAVECQKQHLTYKSLNEKSNRWAVYLRELGVSKNTPVIIHSERSIDLIPVFIGTIKAGGAYLPIDANYPLSRIRDILSDIDIPVLITTNKLVGPLKDIYGGSLVIMDNPDIQKALESKSDQDSGYPIEKNDMAYIIYTSGSTGKPKGIKQKHETLSHFLQGMQERIDLSENDRAIVHTSITFDISVEEIFHTLMTGGTLSILAPGKEKFADAMIDHIIESQCTVLHTVPSMMQAMLDVMKINTITSLPLKKVLVGGEALTNDLVNRFYDVFPDTELFNVYGPAEAPYTTTWLCRKNHTEREIPIGKQLPHLQVYILDEHMQLVPEGVCGELWAGGTGLAIGYTNDGLTQEKFIENPLLTEQERNLKKSRNEDTRIYRIGDIVKYLPETDGFMAFIGRVDNQVKIRGYRIELSEIEEVIKQTDFVKDVIVHVNESIPEMKELIAYIICRETSTHLSDDQKNTIKDTIQKRLPDYMMPKAFVGLETFPLNVNGKIDRNNLPDPRAVDFLNPVEYIGPRNTTETKLVEIWAELLSTGPIGIKDNFFDLGGNSLMIVTMMSRIQTQFGVIIALSDIFHSPTIEKLAEQLDRRTTGSNLFSPLSTITAHGSKPAIVFVHPGDGNLFCYRDLFQTFDSDQPIYGLQAFGTTDGTAALSRIDDMADEYLDTIVPILSEKPFVLAGFCGSGGTIAYEMARQLNQRGIKVPLTILIDSIEPTYFNMIEIGDTDLFMGFMRDFSGLTHIDLVPAYLDKLNLSLSSITEIRRKLSQIPIKNQIEIFWSCIAETNQVFLEAGMDYIRRIFKVYRGQVRALKDYQSKPYDGHVALLRASIRTFEQWGNNGSEAEIEWMKDKQIVTFIQRMEEKPFYGWEDYCMNIHAFDIPGNHFTMLRPPHALALGKKMKDLINATFKQTEIIENEAVAEYDASAV